MIMSNGQICVLLPSNQMLIRYQQGVTDNNAAALSNWSASIIKPTNEALYAHTCTCSKA